LGVVDVARVTDVAPVGLVVPAGRVAVVAEVTERRPQGLIEAQDRPVVAGAAGVVTARVGDIRLDAAAMERAAVEVGGNEAPPPPGVAPRHHVARRDHDAIPDQGTATAESPVVEDSADEPPRPTGVLKRVPRAVVDPQRFRALAAEA